MTKKVVDGVAERKSPNENYKDKLVQSQVNDFRDTFNSHDPKVFASPLMEDAEWTDVMGTTMIGKKKLSISIHTLFKQY